MNRLLQLLAIGSLALTLGCSPQSAQQEQRRGDKTRETVAKATQRMKPELEWSAKKMGQAAEWVADETLAAIEGFFEGWFAPSAQPINLNSASERELEKLPGITAEDARRIVRARPYHEKRELVERGLISETVYARITDHITVHSSRASRNSIMMGSHLFSDDASSIQLSHLQVEPYKVSCPSRL